jgi:hypothetical protein
MKRLDADAQLLACDRCGDPTVNPTAVCDRCREAELAAQDALSKRLLLEWLSPHQRAWQVPS